MGAFMSLTEPNSAAAILQFNIPLLYFSYHVMVGLGTIFVAVMALTPAPQVYQSRMPVLAPVRKFVHTQRNGCSCLSRP
jgi:hypothetical protein